MMKYLCKSKIGMISPVPFRNYNDACEYDSDSVYGYEPLSQTHFSHQDLLSWVVYLHNHINPACISIADPDNSELLDSVLNEFNSSCFAEAPDYALLKESRIREAAVNLRWGYLDRSAAALQAYQDLD